MMKKLLCVTLSAVWLSGCMGSGGTVAPVTPTGTGSAPSTIPGIPGLPGITTPAAAGDITFFDNNVFDQSLGGALQQGSQEVVVNMPSRFSTNKVPDRLGKWFTAVHNSGGKVQLKPVDKGTSSATLVALLGMAYEAYEAYAATAMYVPANQYHAVLFYRTSENQQDSLVEKIIFVHR